MKISIVIPTFNEADNIAKLIDYLRKHQSGCLEEIIVVDGGSTDLTVSRAQASGAKVMSGTGKGRALQMNAGAKVAKGDILYFLHSDTFPPNHFDARMVSAVETGYSWGSFKVRFDWSHWFLRAITFLISHNFTFFRFGDQSLFVKRKVFLEIGGYNPRQIVFEDTEIAQRLNRLSKGRILPGPIITSARKFRVNGVFRMTAIFAYLWMLYHLGVGQKSILARYKKLIVQDKI